MGVLYKPGTAPPDDVQHAWSLIWGSLMMTVTDPTGIWARRLSPRQGTIVLPALARWRQRSSRHA